MLMTGDTTPDGRVISGFPYYDVDEHGSIAAVIEADLRYSEHHYGAGVYIVSAVDGVMPLLLAGDEFSSTGCKSSGIFHDISIADNNVLVTAHGLPARGERQHHHLFYIPALNVAAGSSVAATGDIILGTEHTITSFGIVDHNGNGDYCAGISTSSPLLGVSADGQPHTINMKGNVAYPHDTLLTSASADAGLADTCMVGTGGYGGRVGADGTNYTLLDDGDAMVLAQDGNVLLSTGDNSAAGRILAITTGAVAADGTYYYSAITSNSAGTGMTLFACNDGVHTPLLSTGDVIGSDGAAVEQILFGTTGKHVDCDNRLVFLCSFNDGSTALVVGLPC